jgi:hypothetical protein
MTHDPKRRGRPPLDAAAKSAAVHLKLTPADYDRVDQIARRDRVSIPDVIRRSLRRLLDGGRP